MVIDKSFFIACFSPMQSSIQRVSIGSANMLYAWVYSTSQHLRYACMVITYSKGVDRPGKVANPARGQLNREENEHFSVRVRA